MSCNNYCSRNYSLGSLRNSCHIPVTSSVALCSTSVSYGDALCLPRSCQGSTWLLNNCQKTCREPTKETCGEPTSCQPAICEPSNCETSCCSSAPYYVPTPCQGTSFLPSSSYNPCLPVPCRPLAMYPTAAVHSGPCSTASSPWTVCPVAIDP